MSSRIYTPKRPIRILCASQVPLPRTHGLPVLLQRLVPRLPWKATTARGGESNLKAAPLDPLAGPDLKPWRLFWLEECLSSCGDLEAVERIHRGICGFLDREVREVFSCSTGSRKQEASKLQEERFRSNFMILNLAWSSALDRNPDT